MRVTQQRIPASGPAREALRQRGQFWTPDWIAEAMTAYALSGGSKHLFDPAVGEGAFFRAAKSLSAEIGREVSLLGTEIDPDVLRRACGNGLGEDDFTNVEIRDFVLDPPAGPFEAIVANPPYIRHHRLSMHVKAFAKRLATSLLGTPLDGRAGLHIYFLLRALQVLSDEGRLAFIMPADTCEGVFARALWDWITKHYRLEAVITFESEASPFPGVDTNPVVFLIHKDSPRNQFLWARVNEAESKGLRAWILSGFTRQPDATVSVHSRTVSEGVATGLSRPPTAARRAGSTLGDYAYVVRGIATGANEFFFLTRRRTTELDLPSEFLIPAIGRTRDIEGEEITRDMLDALDTAGRPTLLLSLDARPVDAFPATVRDYLAQGEERGLPKRPLISQRQPWYRMETRRVPLFLFAYLGRRKVRFIRNSAGVRPLTGFLCVYPRSRDPFFVESLWNVLRHPETVAGLASVGKSYGSGAIKVEPRSLERLPLPEAVVQQVGLRPARLLDDQ